MELTLKGDYYEWYCDWCDTRNLTLSFRMNDGRFSCCACHRVTNCEPAPSPLSPWHARDYKTTRLELR